MIKKNPLDLPIEDKIKLCSPPMNEGEKFHGFLEVHFDNINGFGGGKILNLVRDELDDAKVTKFKVAAETGNWSYAFEVPRLTVPDREFDMSDWSVDDLDLLTQIFNLQSGEHRITGASLAKRTTLLFAIVSYKDAYWQIINQSTENIDDLEYIKAARTEKQILMALQLALEVGKFDINDTNQINVVLKDLKIPKGEYEYWVEEVRTANSDIVPIKTYKDVSRKKWVLENVDSTIQFSSKNDHKVQGTDQRIDVSKTFDIYASYKDHKGSEERLNNFRKRKQHLLKNKLNFFRKVVKAADEGVFNLDTDVTWKHLPQTQEECELNKVVIL